MFKAIWRWLVKNFFNLFGLIGVLATFYFGWFYVPDYIKKSEAEKLNNATKEVIHSVKELIYSDSVITVTEITSLISAKEASVEVKFPNPARWILLRAEESFMEDKFIPLNNRRKLLAKLDLLIHQLPADVPATKTEKKEPATSIWTVFSILITTLALALGTISAWARYFKSRQTNEEIENELDEAKTEINLTGDSVDYREIEKNVLHILHESKYELIQHSLERRSTEIDFAFVHNNISFFVEVKVLRVSKVGLRSVEAFIYQLREKRGIGIFIYNTELTGLAASRIRDNNKINKNIKIYPIRFTSGSEVQAQIASIVDSTSKQI